MSHKVCITSICKHPVQEYVVSASADGEWAVSDLEKGVSIRSEVSPLVIISLQLEHDKKYSTNDLSVSRIQHQHPGRRSEWIGPRSGLRGRLDSPIWLKAETWNLYCTMSTREHSFGEVPTGPKSYSYLWKKRTKTVGYKIESIKWLGCKEWRFEFGCNWFIWNVRFLQWLNGSCVS